MESKPLLSLSALTTGYGPVAVLNAIDLAVHPGEIVTVIGGNGAGKTTTLMSISGIQPVRKGSVSFDGADITNHPAHEIVRKGIAHVPEGRKIFPRLSVQENLELGAFTRSDKKEFEDGVAHMFELFPVLKERRTQMAGTLSGGEQQMLAIARALMSKPKLLLMDEPSMGVAPLLVLKIFETIQRLNREGLTVLLVEQNANLALEIAHRGYVLETGTITLSGEGSALIRDPRVRAAYLGEM
jgi:branched-chain amino acid transport system ATP-binding protein